jgi:hypothetical protein
MSAETLLELLKQRERHKPPLMVFHNAQTLPNPSEAEIAAAETAGRGIIHIHFVKSDGNGRPESNFGQTGI